MLARENSIGNIKSASLIRFLRWKVLKARRILPLRFFFGFLSKNFSFKFLLPVFLFLKLLGLSFWLILLSDILVFFSLKSHSHSHVFIFLSFLSFLIRWSWWLFGFSLEPLFLLSCLSYWLFKVNFFIFKLEIVFILIFEVFHGWKRLFNFINSLIVLAIWVNFMLKRTESLSHFVVKLLHGHHWLWYERSKSFEPCLHHSVHVSKAFVISLSKLILCSRKLLLVPHKLSS